MRRVDRWSHTHLFNKDVHLWNRCGHTLWVKVIVAYRPDSDRKRLEPEATATHGWSYGWPYAWSRFDRLDCADTPGPLSRPRRLWAPIPLP